MSLAEEETIGTEMASIDEPSVSLVEVEHQRLTRRFTDTADAADWPFGDVRR